MFFSVDPPPASREVWSATLAGGGPADGEANSQPGARSETITGAAALARKGQCGVHSGGNGPRGDGGR